MDLNTNLKILIVDDHKSMLRIVRNILSQVGFNDVDEALNGEEALKKLTLKKYDIILSDWNMEPMDGLTFLKEVRGNASYNHTDVTFIMVTAEAKPENVIEAKKAGIDNYVTKPFNATTLQSKIRAALQRKAA